jgi:pyruvate/2-oxoacid:ferredoxin oxidoreductase beta subunit
MLTIGCLSTIASLKPKNLSLTVMDNGIYQITGAQPTPSAASSDIVAIARAAVSPTAPGPRMKMILSD